MSSRGGAARARWHLLGVLACLLGLAACGAFQNLPLPAPVVLRNEVIRILDAPGPTPEFYRARAPLEAMGAELDEILVPLIDDRDVSETVRANAAILLADRRSPVAVDVLRRVLLGSESETVRVGALLGLLRSPRTPAVRSAIRAAVSDRSARVRLNVLQALDVEDSALLREMLQREADPQVRVIARQLLGLLEARGAPLVRSAAGDFRSSGGGDGAPTIVFTPVVEDSVIGVARGALWVDVPGRTLVPLSQGVEAVGGVVPAFLDPRGRYLAYEADGEIRVRDLRTGATRVVGPGLAPRPLPFTGTFVFARELPRPRLSPKDTAAVLRYDVLRAAFSGAGDAVRVGTLTAVARASVHGAASPLRWMQVAEARGGFALQGDGLVAPLPLPSPFIGGRPKLEVPPAVTRPPTPCPPTRRGRRAHAAAPPPSCSAAAEGESR